MGTTTTNSRTRKAGRWLLAGLVAGFSLLGLTERADAQEILLTGPLAGAPAVRQLRLYREGRFEVAPAISFTLLDEYQRTMFVGARLNYNLTDWLALGVWGAYGAIKIDTALTDHVQDVNVARRRSSANQQATDPLGQPTIDQRLVSKNVGPDFHKQLGTMDWIVAPQLTAVPFRGKLALFDNVFVDSDLYFFAGPAFIGVNERKDCPRTQCAADQAFDRATRVAIAPTFGLGFSFYVNKWNAIGFEWRGLPFSRNTAGFDTRGGGKDGNFPDDVIDSNDREFKFNQMLTLSYNLFFPTVPRISE